jgi:hypothetical protein
MQLLKSLKRRLWICVRGESSWVNRYGNFRTREQYSLIPRANYVYGMLRAADVAKYCGKRSVTAIEFGVASGAGLLNMIRLAPMIEQETGVHFRIVGFDTGQGLPIVQGYKDHPELWKAGDFATEDRDGLMQKLSGRAEIVWGNVSDTIDKFMHSVEPAAPLGFISVDLDIYSATVVALQCLCCEPEKYTPAVSMYFDDVSFFFANEWAGELAAIAEFNERNKLRKIGPDRSLPGRRPVVSASWYSKMYVCHVLDHDIRQYPREREKLAITDHANYMASQFLF